MLFTKQPHQIEQISKEEHIVPNNALKPHNYYYDNRSTFFAFYKLK